MKEYNRLIVLRKVPSSSFLLGPKRDLPGECPGGVFLTLRAYLSVPLPSSGVLRLAREYVQNDETLDPTRHQCSGFRKGHYELHVCKAGERSRTLQVVEVKSKDGEHIATCMEVWEGKPPAYSPWDGAQRSKDLRPSRRRCVECFERSGCSHACCGVVSQSPGEKGKGPLKDVLVTPYCASPRRQDDWIGCQSQLACKPNLQQAAKDHLAKNRKAHNWLRDMLTDGPVAYESISASEMICTTTLSPTAASITATSNGLTILSGIATTRLTQENQQTKRQKILDEMQDLDTKKRELEEKLRGVDRLHAL